MRTAQLTRTTKETDIHLTLALEGGAVNVSTGIGFFDHMLTAFAFYGGLGLELTVKGDLEVDGHHTVEDVGICLGQAFAQALGDKRGITRYGQFLLPMDETLVLIACDLSGRDYLGWSVDLPAAKVGDFDTELGKEFFLAFVRACPMSLHIRKMAGENTHHILEAVFKGAGRALKMAVALDEKHRDEIPSTKGVL